MLGVYVHPGVGERRDQILEQRDRLTAVHPCLPHQSVGQFGDRPGSVRHPIQVVIVEGQAYPVRGHVGIGLQVPVPESDSTFESWHGVLGPATCPTPVGKSEGARVIEEGPATGGHSATLSLLRTFDAARSEAVESSARVLTGNFVVARFHRK